MIKVILPFLAGAVLLLLVNGCSSLYGGPTPDLVSITITNEPDEAILKAAETVFANHGFAGGTTAPDACLFHRPGSTADNLAYGNSLFDEKVTLQVVIQLHRQNDPLNTLVGCNATLVSEANDPFFADSHPVHRMGKGPYEELLKEIKAQLGQ